MSLPRKLKRLNAFAAGVLLGLCVITPAFAASFTFDSLPPRDWLLMAMLVLLAAMLALRLLRRRTDSDLDPALENGPEDADLRWWRNP